MHVLLPVVVLIAFSNDVRVLSSRDECLIQSTSASVIFSIVGLLLLLIICMGISSFMTFKYIRYRENGDTEALENIHKRSQTELNFQRTREVQQSVVKTNEKVDEIMNSIMISPNVEIQYKKDENDKKLENINETTQNIENNDPNNQNNGNTMTRGISDQTVEELSDNAIIAKIDSIVIKQDSS